MSLIGSLNAAVGGMNAQAAALASISDNVANSQTVGFKETDTAFADYVTQSSATFHAPGAVVALPTYTNSVEGTVTQVSNPTSLAISGNGFFPVSLPTGATTIAPQQFYTRTGDFTADTNGNLVNSTGYVLDGWPATNTAGTTFDTNALAPIQISQSPSAPVPTSNITLAANLPATPPAGTTSYSSTVQVNDASGNVHNVVMSWAQVPTNAALPIGPTNPAVQNQWDLTVTSPSATAATQTTGPMRVTFGDGTLAHPAGTIEGIVPSSSLADAVAATGIAVANATTANTGPGADATTAAALTAATTAQTAATVAQTAGGPGLTAAGIALPAATSANATINLALNFGFAVAQPIALNLGRFGTTTGITQFAGTDYAVAAQTQDGSTQGNFSSVTIQPTGDVVINYDNGSTKTVNRIPLANFGSPDSLQQQNGQAFTATIGSGAASIVAVGTGGSGSLVVGAEEGSNVDIATQFTQMIVAQRAYTANSKVVTTANSMMQDALNMIQG
jgi:flagellar hook protein FlgE